MFVEVKDGTWANMSRVDTINIVVDGYSQAEVILSLGPQEEDRYVSILCRDETAARLKVKAILELLKREKE